MAKKRGNGEGCIRQRKEGDWEARIMIGYNENGKPKYKTFTSKKRTTAAQRLADYIANKKSSESENIYNGTVENWLSIWLSQYAVKSIKVSTRVSYEGIIKNHLIPHIGKIKLAELSKSNIEKMYSDLLESGNTNKKGGLNIKTVRNVALCLHKALQTAVECEYISKNVADIAKIPNEKISKSKKKEVTPLSIDEQIKLMNYCDNSTYCTIIITALHTGLRLGELLGLTWDDVDFNKNTIAVTKQVNRLHDYSENATSKTRLGIQYDTKTYSSERIVSMSRELSGLLRKHRIRQKEHMLKWGSAYNNLGMVFAREDGYYIDPDTFRENYYRILDNAGIEKHTFHALRHTFATRALEAGVPIKVVSNILGHATVQITMDTYQHVLPNLQEDAMNQIADYIYAEKVL